MKQTTLDALASDRPRDPKVGGHQLIEINVNFFFGSVIIEERCARHTLRRSGLMNGLPHVVRGDFKGQAHLRGQI